jgi:hypothetical protein
MVNSLENIDKSKVYVDRIEGLDEVVAGTIYTTLTGAVSSITFSDLQPNKILVSDNIGKVSNSSKGIDDLPDGKTITVSQSNNYQTIGIINQNTSYSEVLKSWSGTKAEYDALKAQPSYYAWIDNYDTLFFTRSLTPSVGDTVYFGANKEDTGYFKVYSFNNGNLVVENVGASYFPVTRDSSQDDLGHTSQIDNDTLYNITDDANGSQNIYNKAEVDTLLNNKANKSEVNLALNNKADINLSNVEIPHLISFETDGTQWCKTYSNGWREQFCVSTNIVSLNSFTNAEFTWQLYKSITTFVSGHATIGGNASIFAADVFSFGSTTEVKFWLHNASNSNISNVTIVGKFYVEGWI